MTHLHMIPAHPVSHLFPPMTDGEYAALKADIEANGQREPITLWHGQIIDGLHRARACDALGRDPLTKEWVGNEDQLVGFVVSLNLHRRHLNESQRAMVAEKIAYRDLSEAGVVREATRAGAPVPIGTGGRVPRAKAAELLNVSEGSVGRARKVRSHGSPVLVAAVERGDVSVARAAELAELPYAEQRKAVQEPNSRQKPMTKEPLARVDRAIDTITHMVEALAEVADHLNGDKRRAEWASRLRTCRTSISRFIAECER